MLKGPTQIISRNVLGITEVEMHVWSNKVSILKVTTLVKG